MRPESVLRAVTPPGGEKLEQRICSSLRRVGILVAAPVADVVLEHHTTVDQYLSKLECAGGGGEATIFCFASVFWKKL